LPPGLDPAGLSYAYQLAGASLPVIETGATEVPEPGTLMLLLAGSCGLLLWRRRA